MTNTTPGNPNQSLLATLGINDNVVVGSSTSGGMIVDVGTSETDSELNALLEVDGLLLYRSTNQVTDAIPGLTLSLEGISDFATDFIVDADDESIIGQLESFVEQYNESVKTIAGQSIIDGTTGSRGPLANDSSISNLRFSLRSAVSKGVTGQTLGAPSFLGDLGIKINNDGTLEISDKDKLSEAVKADASAVQSFFAGEDGITKRLETLLESVVGTNGLISAREESIDQRVKQITSRITTFDDRMVRREAQLRAEYARLEEVLSTFQSQQDFVSAIFR
jgi:flagellar hook-associated protein 2